MMFITLYLLFSKFQSMNIQGILLSELEKCGELNSLQLAKELNVDHQLVVGGLKSLQSLGDVISCDQISETFYELTDEGREVLTEGSHEFRVYSLIPETGITQKELVNQFSNAKIGLNKALAAKWVMIKKADDGQAVVHRLAVNVEDTLQQDLCSAIKDSDSTVPEGIRNELRKRKLVTEMKRTSYQIKKGPMFSLDIGKEETDLSSDLITSVNGANHTGILRLSSINRVATATNQRYHKPSVSSFLKCSGAWNTARFKPYNFKALGSSLPSGHLHPLLRVRSEFAKILADMGFSEMPTNNYVECGFWNFDSLFQPQQHPARDTHDTFFVSEPAKTNLTQSVPESYIERVRLVHSRGSFGSRGYQSDWLLSEAEKNLLRTHTTAVSARMLYCLAQQNPVVPVRYFSIDRVFRNETLDATHLAEFHQVEGLVADYGLSLGHLKAVIRAFFRKLGLTQLRFKPAYNPYTEPSMEIFAYHPGLGKWVEIGNSGIFRPEMLRPMGLPDGLTVIAWGLSLERPTMIRYGYKNIRDLIGPRVDLNMVYNAPLCRIEKF
ncbi:Phenylalanyl-tRNA synthetase alpha subunit [Fasciola gigantica]|uniref:phenylalanine--tRNA ligase n=1 Tax=Fasciola gigantica TaxID=46835 RepID=A0A504XG44_FASGI|nr:Phenylalanyl-tRNA synthetase alpha subunit [Fasciola gigantica]